MSAHESPKRKAAKAKMKAQMFAESGKQAVKTAAIKTRGSWWAPFAANPALPRTQFFATAAAIDRAMQTNPAWKRLDKLQQIGQL